MLVDPPAHVPWLLRPMLWIAARITMRECVMSNVVEAILCVPVLALWFGPMTVIAAPALRASLDAGEVRDDVKRQWLFSWTDARNVPRSPRRNVYDASHPPPKALHEAVPPASNPEQPERPSRAIGERCPSASLA